MAQCPRSSEVGPVSDVQPQLVQVEEVVRSVSTEAPERVEEYVWEPDRSWVPYPSLPVRRRSGVGVGVSEERGRRRKRPQGTLEETWPGTREGSDRRDPSPTTDCDCKSGGVTVTSGVWQGREADVETGEGQSEEVAKDDRPGRRWEGGREGPRETTRGSGLQVDGRLGTRGPWGVRWRG